MIHPITKSVILASIALGTAAPHVSYALNPTTSFAEIKRLTQGGNNKAALELCDKVVDMLNNPKSRVGSQFSYLLPFFLWERGTVKELMGDFVGANADFENILTNEAFRDPKMKQAAANNPGRALSYDQYFTMAQFKVAYNTYRMAVGTEKIPGNPALFVDAAKLLEKYYQLYSSGRVSEAEKKLKLESQLAFLLLQAALLRPEPNFDLAQKYLEMGKKARTPLPDDMVMNALNIMVKLAKEKPTYIVWVDKIISMSPEQYDLGIRRGAKYNSTFLYKGIDGAGAAKALMEAGRTEDAFNAIRATNSLLAYIPDTNRALYQLGAQVNNMKDSTVKRLPDPLSRITYESAAQKQIFDNLEDLSKNNITLDGMGLMAGAMVSDLVDSKRLGKAAYQIIVDKYPNYSTRNADKKVESLRDKNLYNLMMFHSSLGEMDQASAIEKNLGPDALGKDSELRLKAGRLNRLLKEGQNEETLALADELLKELSSDKKNEIYNGALYAKLAALYSMQNLEDFVVAATDFIKEDAERSEILPRLRAQTLFYLMDAYNKLGSLDTENLDKAIETVNTYLQLFPSLDLTENDGLLPYVYHNAVKVYAKRASIKEGADRQNDLDQAYKNCMTIAKNWPEHELTPNSLLLAGHMQITGEDEAKKPQGIKQLEDCYKSALKLPDGKGMAVASNALYWLTSYGPEITMAGETPDAMAKRLKGYTDIYWKDVDKDGDPYSLNMGYLNMKRSAEQGEEAFKAAADKLEKLLTREANYAHKNKTINLDLQKVFPSYIDLYVDTMKGFKKPLDYAKIYAMHTDFPGIAADDKIMRSIIDLNHISMMELELAAIPGDNSAARSELESKITQTFRDVRRKYQPSDLSDYGNVQLGNYLVNYVRQLPDARQEDRVSAVAYFDKALAGRDRSQQAAAVLGKAEALALATDKATRQQAVDLYKQVINSGDDEVIGGALAGLTRLLMAQEDYEAAITMANDYLKSYANNEGKLDMYMLLGEAYAKHGDVQNAIFTYLNLYNGSRARVSHSAPACIAAMELLWKRNKASEGDLYEGNFKASDRWAAWNMGETFVQWIEKAGVEPKLTPSDRDKYRAVARLVEQYASDSTVQAEDRAKREYDRNIQDSK